MSDLGASGMSTVKLHLRLEIYLVLMFELFISSDGNMIQPDFTPMLDAYCSMPILD